MKSLKQEYRETLRVLGIILMFVGAAFLLPLIYVVVDREPGVSYMAFLSMVLIMESVGLGLYMIFKNNHPNVLTYQQGALTVFIAWLFTAIVSTIPFMMLGDTSFSKAFFESMSGWTTTGLSQLDVTVLDRSLLFFRSLIQFFGGFGLVALMVSSIIGIRSVSTLYESEGHDKVLPNIKKTAQTLFIIYITYFLAGTLLYVIVGMPFFDSINHSMSAISTGGFSVKSASIGAYDSIPIEVVTIILMILGSINFSAYILLMSGKFKQFIAVTENKFMLVWLIALSIIVTILLVGGIYPSMSTSLRHGIFESVSAITTTGYAISDYTLFSGSLIFIFVLIMIVGGQSGSTSGGVKMTRINLLRKNIVYNLKKVFQPKNLITENEITTTSGKQLVHKDDMNEQYNYIVLYMATLFFGSFILTTQGHALSASLFEYASTLGTVGLSVNIVSSTMSTLTTWVITLGMFLGRLEFTVILVAILKLFRDGSSGLKGRFSRT